MAVNDLSNLPDEELCRRLPKNYDQNGDATLGRGLRRMRWMNAIRQAANADVGLWFIEYQDRGRWESWASVNKKSLMEWCCNAMREDGLKVRFKEMKRGHVDR